jgi:hypothetical protein
MLQDELKKTALNYLNRSFLFFSEENKAVFRALYEQKIIDDQCMDEALEIMVLKHARKEFEVLVKSSSRYADHVGRPEFLAYAIVKGEFTKKEIAKIPFDHRETAESYCQLYGRKNLIENLRKSLLGAADTKEAREFQQLIGQAFE